MSTPRRPKVVPTAEGLAKLAKYEAIIARSLGPPGIARPVRHGITKRDQRPHDVYIHLDADDAVLYVGISLTLANRTSSHRANSGWWQLVSTIRIEHLPNREAALARESELIAELRPPNNRAGVTSEPATKRDKAAERVASAVRIYRDLAPAGSPGDHAAVVAVAAIESWSRDADDATCGAVARAVIAEQRARKTTG
jgi:predicted GIY-YIG superfamily endonuclease